VAEPREQDAREPDQPGFASSFASAMSGAGSTDRPRMSRRILTVALAVSVAVGGAVLAGVLLHQKDTSASTTVKTAAAEPKPSTASASAPAQTKRPAAKASSRPAAAVPAVASVVRPAPQVTSSSPSPRTSPSAAKVRHTAPKPAIPPASAGQTRIIHSTYWLQPGQSVATNRVKLTMQTNGDLTVTDPDGKVLWSSGTTGRGYDACFQADGNLVVYDSGKQGVWSSGSAGHNDAQLVLQADGNVVIESASDAEYWAAQTQY
jgi:hypothetical protein